MGLPTAGVHHEVSESGSPDMRYSRLGLRRRTPVVTPTGAGIDVVSPRRWGFSDASRHHMNALLIWVYGAWSAALTFRGQLILGPVCALVWFECGLATRRVATMVGRVVEDRSLAARVAPILADLCLRAGCSPPRLALRDDALAAATVRGPRDRPTLVLSRPFADRVSDEELRAILAHEVAHIAHHDLTASRYRGYCALGVGAVVAVVAVVAVGDWLRFLPIWTGLGSVGIIIGSAVCAPSNRWRETRADCDGAALCGDPAVLASALEAAHAFSREARTRYFGPPLTRWLLSPLSWTMPTHPSMKRRVTRLRAMERTNPQPLPEALDDQTVAPLEPH